MEVILKEDIKNVGKAGDVVKVKDGFARNFLFPQGKAIQADSNNLKALEHHKKGLFAKLARQKKEALAYAKQLGELSLTIKRDVGEGDKLFGSVTAKDIHEALLKENIVIDRKQLRLEAPIRELGVFDLPVKLHPEVTANVKVWVVSAKLPADRSAKG